MGAWINFNGAPGKCQRNAFFGYFDSGALSAELPELVRIDVMAAGNYSNNFFQPQVVSSSQFYKQYDLASKID